MAQGLGSGLINPQTIGLIQKHFTGQSRARAFATMATTVALATAVGPVLGGFLIEVLGPEAGWRLMFALNVPLGVATVVLQLLAFRVVDLLLTGLPERIRHGEISAAVVLLGAKLATAVILSAALTG
mgnify:CR=1 FL=1